MRLVDGETGRWIAVQVKDSGLENLYLRQGLK
jgi:hypothetical protein